MFRVVLERNLVIYVYPRNSYFRVTRDSVKNRSVTSRQRLGASETGCALTTGCHVEPYHGFRFAGRWQVAAAAQPATLPSGRFLVPPGPVNWSLSPSKREGLTGEFLPVSLFLAPMCCSD